MSVTIRIIDEVNAYVEGLIEDEVDYIREATKLSVKGAFMDAAYKTGNWDGRESLFQDGLNFQYMLPTMMDLLIDDLGHDPDSFEIVDEREFSDLILPTDPIDENFLLEEAGFPLRDIQIEAVNRVIKDQKGLLDMAPTSGKSLIC